MSKPVPRGRFTRLPPTCADPDFSRSRFRRPSECGAGDEGSESEESDDSYCAKFSICRVECSVPHCHKVEYSAVHRGRHFYGSLSTLDFVIM